MKIIKKIKINGKLKCITGMHIGGSKENADIGGIDLPVIRNSFNNEPFIPGSSLKGKIRSLLEQAAGAVRVGGDTTVNKLFGITESRRDNIQQTMTKLIVRDAYLRPQSREELNASDYTDLPYTEIKFENTINRVLGKAEHPRQIERVPAGAEFDFEFIVNITEGDNEDAQLNLLKKGMKLLELDYLGGNGSRGYGKVVFNEIKSEIYSIGEDIQMVESRDFSIR